MKLIESQDAYGTICNAIYDELEFHDLDYSLEIKIKNKDTLIINDNHVYSTSFYQEELNDAISLLIKLDYRKKGYNPLPK